MVRLMKLQEHTILSGPQRLHPLDPAPASGSAPGGIAKGLVAKALSRKSTIWLGFLSVIFLLSGCVITSEKPFYFSRDLLQDDRVVGSWHDPEDKADGRQEILHVKQTGRKSYVIIGTASDGKEYAIPMRLFRLKGHLFADYQNPESSGERARHELMRIDELGERWVVRTLKHATMMSFLKKNPKALAHRFSSEKDDAEIILTASTRELQAFLLQHLHDAEFYDDAKTLVRVKGTKPD